MNKVFLLFLVAACFAVALAGPDDDPINNNENGNTNDAGASADNANNIKSEKNAGLLGRR